MLDILCSSLICSKEQKKEKRIAQRTCHAPGARAWWHWQIVFQYPNFEMLGCALSTPYMPPAQELCHHRAPSVPSWGTPATHFAAHFSSAALCCHSGVGLNTCV
jgi:hypothetical protein